MAFLTSRPAQSLSKYILRNLLEEGQFSAGGATLKVVEPSGTLDSSGTASPLVL